MSRTSGASDSLAFDACRKYDWIGSAGSVGENTKIGRRNGALASVAGGTANWLGSLNASVPGVFAVRECDPDEPSTVIR